MTPISVWTRINVTKLAEALEISRNSIYKWRIKGVIPAERVVAVEAATDISREELRPDLFKAAANG